MAKRMKLTEILKGKLYQVFGFEDSSSIYSEKLNKMGFVKGTPITLAPVNINDPLVVQIRGSRVALRKKEAFHIIVEEM
jgi:ferrous iron transport protein A